MELSPICKKEYPALRALYRSAFPAAERMPLPRFFALQKKGQAEILVLRTGGAFAGLMIVTFAPATPCSTTLPWSRTAALWDLVPGAAALAAALSQSAGGAGGGAAGSYGTQRPAAATAAGFLCQKRLSPLQLAGTAVRRGTGCAHARRAGTGFCRLSRVLSPDLWPSGAPFCAKAPIKRRRAKFSLYFGRGWCRIVADF